MRRINEVETADQVAEYLRQNEQEMTLKKGTKLPAPTLKVR